MGITKINGFDIADISKINGIDLSDITKINGIELDSLGPPTVTSWGVGAGIYPLLEWGYANRVATAMYGESWSTIVAGAGTSTGAGYAPTATCDGYPGPGGEDLWGRLEKCLYVANTSILTGSVSSARMGIYVTFPYEVGSGYYLNMYSATMGDESNIQASDYNNIGSTISSPKAVASLPSGGWAWWDIPPSHINLSGNTVIACCYSSPGAWVYGGGSLVVAAGLMLEVSYYP